MLGYLNGRCSDMKLAGLLPALGGSERGAELLGLHHDYGCCPYCKSCPWECQADEVSKHTLWRLAGVCVGLGWGHR